MTAYYKANKSRSQNRRSWSIMFRHPLRKDPKGKCGLKIRRGLGTENEIEAEILVQEMNRLLEDETFWSLSAKPKALHAFDERIVNAFYDNLEPKMGPDPWSIREKIQPLPTTAEGYAKVQFIGTTGSGKTTLLRQLIGTHPEKDRFPSTSTAKTTVCDMEIILKKQPIFEAVVTFFSYEKIRIYVEECVMNCGKSYVKGDNEQTIIRHLFEHTNQRFRLSYLLGNLTPKKSSTLLRKSPLKTKSTTEKSIIHISPEERKQMEESLVYIINLIKQSAVDAYKQVQTSLSKQVDESQDIEEALEVKFEELWKENESYSIIVEHIMDEIEKRFSFVPEGSWEYNSQEWPVYWTFSKDNRKDFIEGIKQMSSNHANHFGKLLTPLVQGIRIVGPFQPTWYKGEIPKLVLMDGEGLGHQAGGSISTTLSKKMDDVDAILLVDNSQSPMISEPINALKHIVTTGHTSKLHICFTHFDEVKGDNLPEIADKESHVIGSLENALEEIGKKLGANAQRHLTKQMQKETFFFLGGIHEVISETDQYTTEQLSSLVEALEKTIAEVVPNETFPIYNGKTAALATQRAAEEFYKRWNGILNLSQDTSLKEHWRRIQALSRRFAELGEDEYDGLRPIADLIMMLRENLFTSILDNPIGWTAPNAPEEMKQESIDQVAGEFNKNLHQYIKDTMWNIRMSEWMQAYLRSGTGSTKVRARDIQAIYKTTIPEPHEFKWNSSIVHEIYNILKSSIEVSGGKMKD
ncbi:GTPase domain-containing protein [Anaerobacillus sp. MEB173]|uniref:GTPase domain-containing protein n=1 Tax=Anaerobacillus sp. MEB173 TaxID=3383345 RepID=UPI003F8F11D9